MYVGICHRNLVILATLLIVLSIHMQGLRVRRIVSDNDKLKISVEALANACADYQWAQQRIGASNTEQNSF